MQARHGKARALLVLALLAGGALLYQFLGSADSTEPLSLPLAESEQEEDPTTASEEDDSEQAPVAAESQAPAIEDGSQAEALSGSRTQQAPRLIHGLVRDDQGRGLYESPCDGHSLLLASRELGRTTVHEFAQSHGL